MEEKKKQIQELRKKSIRKRRLKEAAAIALIAVLLVSGGFYGVQKIGLSEINIAAPDLGLGDSKESKDANQKQISIGETIKPYSTSIRKNKTVKIVNQRSETVSLSFETNEVQKEAELGPEESTIFNPSGYSRLPRANYFNINGEETGQIILKNQ